jgi:hypothetical protein
MQLESNTGKAKSPIQPWLKGTYRTPKGRILTGEDLCSSLERMYGAYATRSELSSAGSNRSAPGSGVAKILPQEELDAVVQRLYQSKVGACSQMMIKVGECPQNYICMKIVISYTMVLGFAQP